MAHSNQPNPPPPPDDVPLARSLGRFFGHIWAGVKTDVRDVAAPSSPAPIRRETVEERVIESDQGPMLLRRRVIDEAHPIKPSDTPQSHA